MTKLELQLLTDPESVAPEDGGCTCTVYEPGWVFISPECEIHSHLLFQEESA